jgi:hypothetical protein
MIMFLMEALFALVMALLFTAIFTLGFRRPGPWSSVLTFFVIVFLAAWAGSLWLSPAGPVFVGIYWLPIIMVALLFALLLSAMVPPRPPTQRVETISQVKQEEKAVQRMYNVFFWTLLAGFIAIIILGYAFRHAPVS